MPKKLVAALLLIGIFTGLALTAQGRYVRKQRQPEFFMPAKVQFNQPEKLPPLPEATKPAEQELKPEKPIAPKVESKKYIPDFQTKFDSYNNDVIIISKTGKVPENQALKNDLAAMRGDEQFLVPAINYQTSEVSDRFFEVLEKELSQD